MIKTSTGVRYSTNGLHLGSDRVLLSFFLVCGRSWARDRMNLHHSRDPSHTSDNTGSLTYCTRELLFSLYFWRRFCSDRLPAFIVLFFTMLKKMVTYFLRFPGSLFLLDFYLDLFFLSLFHMPCLILILLLAVSPQCGNSPETEPWASWFQECIVLGLDSSIFKAPLMDSFHSSFIELIKTSLIFFWRGGVSLCLQYVEVPRPGVEPVP